MEEHSMKATTNEQQGLQLPSLQENSTSQEETAYYLEAANGMTVRVPESKLEAWQAEQDRQRKGIGLELTEREKQFVDQILERIYGSKK